VRIEFRFRQYFNENFARTTFSKEGNNWTTKNRRTVYSSALLTKDALDPQPVLLLLTNS